jgi:ABC-type transport system involved in multi-copper enzyme maturation permease subunit
MKRMLKTQFFLLFGQKFFIVLCSVAFGLAILNLLTYYFMGSMVDTTVTGITMLQTLMTEIMTYAILCIIFAGYFFNKDFANRTINIAVCSGVNRATYWAAKCIAFIIGCFIICLIAPITLTVGGTIIGGWGEDFDIAYLLRTAGLYLLSMLSIISVFSVFASIFTETSSVVAISIAFCAVFQIGTGLLALVFPESEILAETLGNLPNITSLAITQPEYVDKEFIIKTVSVDSGLAVILFGLSYLIFRKRDLK